MTDKSQYNRLSKLVADKIGLYFPDDRWRDLARGIKSAAGEFGYQDEHAFTEWLFSVSLSKEQLVTLASHLTVGETYFFREEKTFKALENHVLPNLIDIGRRRGKRLRIWSAGCSTGEEPYSIAILLSKMLPDLADWQITILATDINHLSLKKATDCAYGKWAFRGTPSWVKNQYFKKAGKNLLKVISPIKKMVTFANLNLVEDIYPSLLNNTIGMDLILCRNVLMYFHAELGSIVTQRFAMALVREGCLIVSPTEASIVIESLFDAADLPDAIYYKKAPGALKAPVKYSWLQATPPLQELEISPPPYFFDPLCEACRAPGLLAPDTEKTIDQKPLPIPELPEPKEKVRQLCKQGSYSEAANILNDLGKAGSQENFADRDILLLLAREYANHGDLVEAIFWCKKAIKLDTLDLEAHYLAATILQAKDRLQEATASLKRVLYIDQDFVLAHFMLGNILARSNKAVEAKKYFKNALALLAKQSPEASLPEADGLTAGRLSEIIQANVNNMEIFA